MNTSFLIIPFISLALISACNQADNSKNVPENIKNIFMKSHPNATILKWNDESPVWEAKYKDGDETGAVSYNADCAITETELVVNETQLPNDSLIPNYIKTNYPNEKIQSCEKITKANGSITYEIQITGKEVVFDHAGKFLEVEKD